MAHWWRKVTKYIALGSWVIVHTVHVVKKIPMAWEAISGNATVAAFVGTEVRLVSMHAVGFALMAKETCSRRKLEILALQDFAPVWFYMGIYKFTTTEG